jgi:hypothetical protein
MLIEHGYDVDEGPGGRGNLDVQISDAASAAAKQIDLTSMVNSLGERKPEFLACVEGRVRASLLSLSPKDAWSLSVGGSSPRTLSLSNGREYGKAMVALLRKKDLHGCPVESAATPVVLSAVDGAIAEFYAGEQIVSLMAVELERQVRLSASTHDVVSDEMKDLLQYFSREVRTAAISNPAKTVAIDRVTHLLCAFFATAAGHEVLSLIGHAAATSAGKAAITKIGVAAGHAVASGAIKESVLLAVKKVSVGALIKTTVGKAIIASLVAAVPIKSLSHHKDAVSLAIGATIVAGVGVYQYGKLPAKLAEEIPGKVSEVLGGEFNSLGKSVCEPVVKGIIETALWDLAGGKWGGVATT